jgi:hypothetical protein
MDITVFIKLIARTVLMYQTTPCPIVAQIKLVKQILNCRFPKLSFNGLVLVFPSDLPLNTRFIHVFRIKYETPTITIEIQNGTLQPQRSNCSGVRMLLVARITINEMNNPTVAVVCIQEVQYPL